MIITMHCGGMPFDGETINNSSLGGSETAGYYLARELARKGHQVTIFTNREFKDGENKVFDGVKYEFAGYPTEKEPLGHIFHFYALHTPCDVMIIQRDPRAFVFPWNSKVNIWWSHDLALHRMADAARGQMANVDQVWTVSEWHAKQVREVYGFDEDVVRSIRNGVDLSLFDEMEPAEGGEGETKLLYTSRPERGLEHLVRPGGIMERLEGENFRLYVCMYDNIADHMRGYYQYLHRRCHELPNVSLMGHLSKPELVSVMKGAHALVYPTEFEETSCITAMEAMAAGLPFISSEAGALPETCDGSGSFLLPLTPDGVADEDAFVEILKGMPWGSMEAVQLQQKEKAKSYDWSESVKYALENLGDLFGALQSNHGANVTELMEKSDIYALRYYVDTFRLHDSDDPIVRAKLDELEECYQFMESPEAWREHYRQYYEREKEKGVQYGYAGFSEENGREYLDGNHRFEHVAALIGRHLADSNGHGTVVDYGCAHGHYLVNLARRFPGIEVIGIDIAESNVGIARAWADEEGISGRAEFHAGEVRDGRLFIQDGPEDIASLTDADVVIAAEVLEHLEDYQGTIQALCNMLKPGGLFIATTPYGPWESEGYKQEWPWRAHVHHFERNDLENIAGHLPEFSAEVVKHDNRKGSYVWHFRVPEYPRPEHFVGSVDYDEKLSLLVPSRQTVSLCMIAKNAEDSIVRCLKGAAPHVDEIIIAVDETTDDGTERVAKKFMLHEWPEKPFRMFRIPSPLETGFDAARNASIERASGQWILWLDADEELFIRGDYKRLMRHNQFNAYGIPQQHLAMDPPGLIKTDYPTRLFRNHRGVRFYGRVHEHPEVELNKGIPETCVIDTIQIAHFAYKDEPVRMGRFNRNIGLLVRDREELPERLLGKFLWLRDLAQMCEQELMENGMQVTPDIMDRAKAGVAMFEDLLEDGNARMIHDVLPYYSTCAKIMGQGFEFGIQLDASKLNGGAKPERAAKFAGFFHSRAHVDKLIELLINERTQDYESRYF